MTSFKTHTAFFLLLPLALIVVWYFLNRKNKRPSIQFSKIEVFKQANPSLRAQLVELPRILKVIAIILAIIALARPQRADEKVKKNVEGIDIIIALDVSDSMLIEDMKPAANRLESSKQTIYEFIKKRLSDRIGLIVFSGESYTRVPLTLDYELLLGSLSEVQISRTVKLGTAIGVALANAVGRLKESTAKSRIVIFLTDGESNSGLIDPETALEIAKGYGVKIYSIGVGRDGKTQLPVTVRDIFGRKVKRYQPFYSKVNVELLTKMAQETGGKFYRATSSSALENVFADIGRLEKSQIEVNRYVKYVELFPIWLKVALGFYLLAFFLNKSFLRRSP